MVGAAARNHRPTPPAAAQNRRWFQNRPWARFPVLVQPAERCDHYVPHQLENRRTRFHGPVHASRYAVEHRLSGV